MSHFVINYLRLPWKQAVAGNDIPSQHEQKKNSLKKTKHIDQPFTMDKAVNQNGENMRKPMFLRLSNVFSAGGWSFLKTKCRERGNFPSDHPIIPESSSRRGSAGLDKKARSAGGRESSGPWWCRCTKCVALLWRWLCGWLIMVYKPPKTRQKRRGYHMLP